MSDISATSPMQSIFVYFKAPAANRDRVNSVLNHLGTGIAASTGAGFTSARRADRVANNGNTAVDTWLEHYRCPDDKTALAVMSALELIDPAHPLLVLIEGGLEGRHLEHFRDASACV